MELHVADPPSSSADGIKERANGAAAAPPQAAAEVEVEQPAAESASAPPNKAAAAAARARKRRRRRVLRLDAPAWAVSLAVHVTVLTLLGLATFSSEVQRRVANINSALVANPTGA